MYLVLNTLRLRVKHTWQRITRGYGDDEIDWDRREKIANEVKKEMEDKFGLELAAMRQNKTDVLACEDIISDMRLSRESKLAKVREHFPGETKLEVYWRSHYSAKIENKKRD